jgi:hypothetical protein
MEEATEQRPLVHRPNMPHRPNRRVQTKVVDFLCGMMVRRGVVLVSVQEILWVLELFTIWETMRHDMRSLMRHIFGALDYIETLMDVSHDSTPSLPS